MAKVNFAKVNNQLPSTLEPNTHYYVKTPEGVLQYMTTGTEPIEALPLTSPEVEQRHPLFFFGS